VGFAHVARRRRVAVMIGGDLTRDKRARSASRAHRARPLRGGAGDPTLARVRPDGAGRRKGPGPVSVLERFLRRLPVRRFETPEGPLPPDGPAARHIRRVERILVATAAALAVLGFLAYYVPVYRVPDLFPSASVTVPLAGGPVTVPWGELSWAIALTTVELLLLTFLNIVGVHEIAVGPVRDGSGEDAGLVRVLSRLVDDVASQRREGAEWLTLVVSDGRTG